MKELLIGILVSLCLILPGCNHAVENEVSGCTDDLANNFDALATVDDGSCEYPFEEVDKIPDPDPPEIEQPPEEGDPGDDEEEPDDSPEEGDDGDQDVDEGDDAEPVEQPDSDGDGVIDEEDQCEGEDDTVDDDASGEPDCIENQS